MNNRSGEFLSAVTHLIGALLSVIALVILVNSAVETGTIWHIVGFSVFGVTLVLLYLASSIYHFTPSSKNTKDLFRKIDHCMIFILIAGTYTPISLVSLHGVWGWSILAIAWGIAILGVFLKITTTRLQGWQSVTLYLLMGWIAVIAIKPLFIAIPLNGLLWLLAGGLSYTVGTIFLTHRTLHFPWLRAHDIFHIFVMFGSFSHFWLMLKYVL